MQAASAPLLMADHQTTELLLQETTVRVVCVSGGGKARDQAVHLTLSASHLLVNYSPSLPRGDGGNYSTFGGSGEGPGSDGIFVVPLTDVTGSKVVSGGKVGGVVLHIYRYTKPANSCCTSLCGGKGLRHAAHLSFSFPSDAEAQDWSAHLSCLLRDSLPQSPVTRPPAKRFLVLVNPVSGKGQGRSVWAAVEGMFQEASQEASVQVITTTHANHAYSHVNALPLVELLATDAIVIVAGDGLVYEVVNGIMDRRQRRHRPEPKHVLETETSVRTFQ